MAELTNSVDNDTTATRAEDTSLAKGVHAEFFERNKAGIQYVDVSTRTYYIKRGWTLRGPIPKGTQVAHTGLDMGVTPEGFKRYPYARRRTNKRRRKT